MDEELPNIELDNLIIKDKEYHRKKKKNGY